MKLKLIHLIFLIVFVTAILVILGFLAQNEQNEQISMLNTEQAPKTQTQSWVQTSTKRAANTKTQQLVQETVINTATQTHNTMLQSTSALQAEARLTSTPALASAVAATDTPGSPDLTTIESTSTQPAGAVDTPVPIETEIVTPIDWTGSWTAFFGQEGGVLFRATLIVSRIDNNIVGLHSIQTFTGILSADGMSVIGTWVNPPTSGSFYWSLVSENQFCGNTEKAFAYCAARSGAVRPDPCFCRSTTD